MASFRTNTDWRQMLASLQTDRSEDMIIKITSAMEWSEAERIRLMGNHQIMLEALQDTTAKIANAADCVREIKDAKDDEVREMQLQIDQRNRLIEETLESSATK